MVLGKNFNKIEPDQLLSILKLMD